MNDQTQHTWDHPKLLSIFTGLLVFFTFIYSITTIFQWRSMSDQARLMGKQLDAMKADIEDTKLNRSADLMLRFDEQLDKKPNPQLRMVIQSGKPILKVHGGKFTEDDLEGYLGIFDALSDLYEKGMINKELFYNNYSYDIEKAYDNSEVQSYLKELRKTEADDYIGFDDIAQQMLAATAAGTYKLVKQH